MLIVPFPPGSGTDTTARKLSEGLQKQLGQTVIVENKAGADGIVAARAAAAAPPDGYTIFITTNPTHSANPNLYRQLPYDPKQDFAPIGGILQISYMLAVRAEFPATDFADFVKVAKAANPPLSFGSGNTGSRAAGKRTSISPDLSSNSQRKRGDYRESRGRKRVTPAIVASKRASP